MLNASSRLFFGSGIWFAITAVLDTTGIASNFAAVGNTTALSAQDFAAAHVEAVNVFLSPLFLAGIIPLAFGLICGFYVVEAVSGLGGANRVTISGATIEMGLILFLFFVAGFDGVFLYVFRPIIEPVLLAGSPLIFFIASLAVSMVSAFITFFLLLVNRTRTAIRVMSVLVGLPVWVAFVLGVLLELKLIHF